MNAMASPPISAAANESIPTDIDTDTDTCSVHEEAVRRFVDEVINGGNHAAVADLVSADHVGHCPDGDLYGPDGVKLDLRELRTAFPDLRIELEDVIAAGDRVARRFVLRGTHAGPFLGFPPTGRVVSMGGMGIDRLRAGRIAETWITFDVRPLSRP
jgi:steroid delta-isomerase-like uncharacterized protein